MALVSISEAAKLVRRNRTTLYRDIEKGRLSKTVSPEGDTRIDTSELLRAYGRLYTGDEDIAVSESAQDRVRIALLEEKNRSLERALALEAELRRVKDQVTAELRARISDKERAIKLLESRLLMLEYDRKSHASQNASAQNAPAAPIAPGPAASAPSPAPAPSSAPEESPSVPRQQTAPVKEVAPVRQSLGPQPWWKRLFSGRNARRS